jgi:hypothetical protein
MEQPSGTRRSYWTGCASTIATGVIRVLPVDPAARPHQSCPQLGHHGQGADRRTLPTLTGILPDLLLVRSLFEANI